MKPVLAIASFIICITFQINCIVQAEENFYKEGSQMFFIEPKQEFTWLDSVIQCKKRNMDLVTLDTQEKVQRLQGVLRKVYLDKNRPVPKLYIGGTDSYDVRKFVWITTSNTFLNTNWDKNEPNNHKSKNELCVQVGHKGTDKWNDINCSNKLGYICETPYMMYDLLKKGMSGN